MQERGQRIEAPMAAAVVEVAVAAGDVVRRGQRLIILEAMKMEHELFAPADARILRVLVAAGDSVETGQPLLEWRAEAAQAAASEAASAPDAAPPAALRADLLRVVERHAHTLDANRPEAVARRRSRGQRTARENIAAVCDRDTFMEYGALAVAAQSRRRSHDDLMRQTPADGIVTGIGSVEGQRCVVMAYDATVLAGTQGMRNHQKTDRMLDLALRHRLPVVLFAEGGGGRPGDTDSTVVAGLFISTFARFAKLSGQVPLIGIASGRCFAGNAALLGCCDLIIATRVSNIGMGGPAIIEGGGLGVVAPEAIGPSEVQAGNGVIDVLVADEVEAAAVARCCCSYLSAATSIQPWSAAAPAALREALPANRVRSYDMRSVMGLIADTDSVLELGAGFGAGVLTAFARIEGHSIGVLASNPAHLGGAIDADAADKAVRFMELCNAHRLPLVSLVDTPGFMVGPAVEAQAQVRRASRMFIAGARLTVPFFAVVLRKAYGLGAMAMTGGGFHVPVATVAWPSAEFGAMGLEGAVRLGYRKELEALPEGTARDAMFESLLAERVSKGAAIAMAESLEIDAVIDPAVTREWLVAGLQAAAG